MRITKDMIQRAGSKTGLLDPCVICGGALVAERWVDTGKLDRNGRPVQKLEPYPGHSKAESCGHSMDETAGVIQHIRGMSPEAVAQVMAGE